MVSPPRRTGANDISQKQVLATAHSATEHRPERRSSCRFFAAKRRLRDAPKFVRTTLRGQLWVPIGPSILVSASRILGRARRLEFFAVSQTRSFRLPLLLTLLLALSGFSPLQASDGKKTHAEQSAEKSGPMKAETFSGLALRGIGPAMVSGRITDLAVHPTNKSIWYVAAAVGGLWKTNNAGTTWAPIFDDQGSFSLGCVTLDPNNPLVVWVGSGENNSQRSVAYGDGVYRSLDGGTTWTNMGLKHSEHISKIVVDPRDSNVVWVAAQGPLWSSGGERGLYVTRDGGQTWNKAFETSEHTGVTEVHLDPRNPDVMFASTYQRQRHVWTVVNGGPESGLRKSTDGGKTWRKISNGLPAGDIGRIGLALSPANPDTIYAIMDAAGKDGGLYRSVDGGENWEKRSDYVTSSGQYYNELFADPKVVDRFYSMDTWMNVSDDGGKTMRRVGEAHKHVDNHVLWIDPADTDHLLAGCDGGLYQSFDRGATWQWSGNLPLSQFYKVGLDNDLPFYNIYGGTQDNNSVGGPSRTRTTHGIVNSDWFITLEGDGFQTVVDPTDANIVYAQAQHAVLVRYDRRTGESVDVQPQADATDAPLRWNWDSPLIISPHQPTRLYFAAQRVFRSDDRGNSWVPVSGDLTRQIDRNQLPLMGRVWGVDAVAKNTSTSFYGNIVALAESARSEGLLAVGTDDGLIQISADGGANWRRIERFPGVPERSYVSRVLFSQHDSNTLYAAFDNHKQGDFKPYLLRSSDLGKTWTSIAPGLPERGTVYALVEDHVKPTLLFAGTEFGLYFSPDQGRRWIQLKGGMPTIQVRDLAIQQRENDLVAATFGRGFYVLDDYSPLRDISDAALQQQGLLFPVKPAFTFAPTAPFGGTGKGFNGDQFFVAPNPPLGAVFTYYLKDELQTRAQKRQKAEKALVEKGADTPYPTWEDLKREAREEAPVVVLTVSDADGHVVRRIEGPAKAGIQRVSWDLRYPAPDPTNLAPAERDPWTPEPVGPLVAPGQYRLSMATRVDGQLTSVGEPQSFTAAPLGGDSLPPADRKALLEFQIKTGELQRAALGAVSALTEAQTRIDHLKRALADTPRADPALAQRARAIESRLKDLQDQLLGDSVRASRGEPAPAGILGRIGQVVYGHWYSSADATATHRRNYEIAAQQFAPVLAQLRTLILEDLAALEAAAEAAGAPWTPGRVPNWE
jgi:photosystem II stability/assembly factor-like uncharacterized protein